MPRFILAGVFPTGMRLSVTRDIAIKKSAGAIVLSQRKEANYEVREPAERYHVQSVSPSGQMLSAGSTHR
jgi:hypothetical protein